MKLIAMLETIQVGTPHHYALPVAEGERERSWQTSFFRQPSPERRWLSTTHLVGNAQADTTNHGTPNQAVLLYAAIHYPAWRQELDRLEIGPGGFGENFTVDGLDETTTCIGDVYAVGDAQKRQSTGAQGDLSVSFAHGTRRSSSRGSPRLFPGRSAHGEFVAQCQRFGHHLIDWLHAALIPGGAERGLARKLPGSRDGSREPLFLLQGQPHADHIPQRAGGSPHPPGGDRLAVPGHDARQ
jgi:hypothetical protein